MTIEKPYFMTNEDWFEDDLKTGKLKLTPEAPPKAVESYKEFYKALEQ